MVLIFRAFAANILRVLYIMVLWTLIWMKTKVDFK